MIETHVINALLNSSLREGSFFAVLNFINGLVAPSFLFCAGFALAISLHRRWESYIHLERPFWRYLVRLGFILIVGYSLHLPFFSFRRMRELTDGEAWSSFFQVDILQVIAVTLLALVCLAILARKKERWVWISSLAAAAVILVSPMAWELDFSGLPIWLRPFLTTSVKTQFPLFPWAAFLISGTVIGSWFVKAKETEKERPLMKRLPVLAAAGIGIAILFAVLPINFYANQNFWGPSPEFFLVRLGFVVLGLTGFWWYERLFKPSSKSLASIFGQESLLVYVVHLLIVYGQDYDWSLVRAYGQTLSHADCFIVFLLLTGAMFVLANVWHRLKAWNKQISNVVQFAVLGVLFLRFLTR
jgi:uncharacterized membrane protein